MEKNKGDQVDLSFLRKRDGESFSSHFGRVLEGLKKLSPEDNELVAWVMKGENKSFEDALNKVETLLSIGMGKYSPARRKTGQ